MNVDAWGRILDACDPATFGEVASAAEEYVDDVDDGAAAVEAALDAGDLVEEGDGMFPELSLADRDDTEDEQPGADPSDRDEPAGPIDSGAGWETILDRAQALADREWWEPVEEDALETAFDEAGHAVLLTNGDLTGVDRWTRVDLSDDGDEPDVRWYYARGDEPRVEEFRRFHELLTAEAPDDYTPWYFAVKPAGKAPDARGSWKAETARLTYEEAVERLRDGGNVGVAGRPDGPLVNIDVDDDEETTPADLVDTLRAISRSRSGWHGWAFNPAGDIPNLPADHLGEIRTDWQYVVAPGSFVASAAEEIPDGASDPGYYTVAHEAPVATIDYDDLPVAFREWEESRDDTMPAPEDAEDVTGGEGERTGDGVGGSGGGGHDGTSAVFDVEATDLADSTDPSDRWTSLFHGSDTSANMSVSGEGKLQCWRHSVAHGGLQALATLSDHSPSGDSACRKLGTGHTHSNAGGCAYTGDWRLVWWAWEYAKGARVIPDDDPIPYRALLNLAVADGVADRDDLVEREADDGGTYTGFPDAEAYNAALEHVEETYGRDPGREPASAGGGGDGGKEYDDDPREVDATVDPRRAWDAAGRVTPDDLDEDLLTPADDGEAFACPDCGGDVDVVRAVAVREGLAHSCDAAIGEAYPEAYSRARGQYGAPLPEYYTTADSVAEFDAVLSVISEVTFWHLDAGRLNSDVTGEDDEVSGDAVRTLDPAWRESESGESVLVFDSGTIWDADSEKTLDVLRFVALDDGLIDDPSDNLGGGVFTDAYRLARREYGAPLPRWEPADDGEHAVTPMLPPSEELIDDPDDLAVRGDRLTVAREDVEALIRRLVREGGDPTVVTALPATGKTTGAVKTAGERPLSYLAPRKELQQQALDKAERWDVDAEILPVFGERTVRDDVLAAAVSHVRDRGKGRLRDHWAVFNEAVTADEDVEDEDDGRPSIFKDELEKAHDGEASEEVDLDRPTCATAEGAYGEAWALVAHVARRLGYTPQEIHTQARGLFGAPLPCTHDEDDEEAACPYSEAWSDVADPDEPADLLVGSYVHAHVESVRTEYSRGPDGDVVHAPRAVVLDEFPGEAFSRDFGSEAMDFATWLASSLREDVGDRLDMHQTDLWDDEWVRKWIDGEGHETGAVGDAVAALAREGDLLDARAAAEEILAEIDHDVLRHLGLEGALTAFSTGETPPAEAYEVLREAADVDHERPASGVVRWVEEDVVVPLASAAVGERMAVSEAFDVDELPVGGELRALVGDALDAAEADAGHAREAIEAAVTALRGGPEGCRRLAAWGDDGYAHPDAHHLLRAVVTPKENEDVSRGATSKWAFDPEATDGTVVETVRTGERATTVLDRNEHGAILHTPPQRTAAGGGDVPLIGLDATGRRDLWSVALGERADLADIHETAAERAAFLEEALGLHVIQASDCPRPYEGGPGGKDLDGDVALLEELADGYSGLHASRERGGEPTPVGNPACITTRGVRSTLEDDERLADVVAEWENYGNLTGDNALGQYRLAAILGSQHYGDAAVERFCALAGEFGVDTSREGGRGADLSYGNALADEYLTHMRDDQTMQAILRFARGDTGATVVCRTSALRDDLPVVGRGQVIDTWSNTATQIARQWRRLGQEFTAADVRDVVDVGARQVRNILAEFVEAGYLTHVSGGDGTAKVYDPLGTPSAGEVSLPDASEAVSPDAPGTDAHNEYYTWNYRVGRPSPEENGGVSPVRPRTPGAPPSPTAVDGAEPPD